MDHCISDLQSRELLEVLKIIYLFLLHHNFEEIAHNLKTYCHTKGIFFEAVATKSIFFKRCKTGFQFNQYNSPSFNLSINKSSESCGDGVEIEKLEEQAQVIYICDHDKSASISPNTRKMSRYNPQKTLSPRLDTMFELDEFLSEQGSQELVKLKSKFSDLHGEHQKLLAVTSELTNTLQMNIIGQSQNIYTALEHCKAIYPSLFANQNHDSHLKDHNQNQTRQYCNNPEQYSTSNSHSQSSKALNNCLDRSFYKNPNHNFEESHSHTESRSENSIHHPNHNTERSFRNPTHSEIYKDTDGHLKDLIHATSNDKVNEYDRLIESGHENIYRHNHSNSPRSHGNNERENQIDLSNDHSHTESRRHDHIAERSYNTMSRSHNPSPTRCGQPAERQGYSADIERRHPNDNVERHLYTHAISDCSPISALKNSPRFEDQKNAIVDHIMTHTSKSNSPRSTKTHEKNSPKLPEKSSLIKEKVLDTAHFVFDINDNDRVYPSQYGFCEVEPLNLRGVNEIDDIPEIKHPLTPETVRHVLDLVFNRIFEIESVKPDAYTRVVKSAPLSRDDVKKVVDDVFEDMIVRNQVVMENMGAGEGEVSKIVYQSEKQENEKSFDLDYDKIKQNLVGGDTDRKVRLLQSLRWRITKNDNPNRDRVMEAYILNDILDLYSGVCLPEILLNKEADVGVQESICRLINTIASLRQGRDYLTSEDKLLKRILLRKVKDLRHVSSAVIRNMLLASVQKLSIRKQCRNQMVYEGLLEVLVDYLDEFHEKLSRYSLEYSSALVMNLCLVEEAKERSKKMSKKIVGLIKKLLEGEKSCCLPYVNGIMFSLLEKEEIVKEAISQNLDKLIIKLIRTTKNDNMKKQLDFILQSRLFGKGEPLSTDNEDDGREEVDLLEVELDEDDFLTKMPCGEALLEEYKISYWMNPKPSSESARSFCEETKQFYHKPSLERGIFEGTSPRKVLRPHGLINNYMTKKSFATLNGFAHARGKWSGPTPLCYMENCQKMMTGGSGICSCTKCIPGQSRYSCGCYDVIKKELSEIESKELVSKSSDLLKKEVDVAENIKKSSLEITKNVTFTFGNKVSKKGGKTKKALETHPEITSCKICGEKSCDCAFDSRPKLNRTPPKNT